MVDTATGCNDNTAVFHSWHGLGGGSSSPRDDDSPTLQTSSLLPSFRRQGSIQGKKILPNVPDMDTQMSLSAKMIDRRTCTPRGNHSYTPFFLEYSLLAEYNLVKQQKIPGVYVIPSEHTSLVWYGVIFIRQGLYQEGIFRFKLFIPDNFPDGDCPRLVFDDFVFHPMVDPVSHEMNVQRCFNHRWKRNVYHIWQILLYARRCFYKIDTKEPLNTDAAELYDRSGSEEDSDCVTYRSEVRQCVMKWRDRIYEKPDFNDAHYLVFTPFDPKVHETSRQTMLAQKSESNFQFTNSDHEWVDKMLVDSLIIDAAENKTSRSDQLRVPGHSFMEPGSLRIFTTT